MVSWIQVQRVKWDLAIRVIVVMIHVVSMRMVRVKERVRISVRFILMTISYS